MMLAEGDGPKKKPSIDELERMLDRAENENDLQPIQILPNGQIRAMDGSELPPDVKPITMREDVGGEYACIHNA